MVNVTHRSNKPRAGARLIALTCGALASVTQAAPPAADMTRVKVTYGDLNLASKQGNQVLLARIRRASRSFRLSVLEIPDEIAGLVAYLASKE